MEKWLKLDTSIPPIYAKSIDEFNAYVKRYQANNEVILTKSHNISQQTLRNLPAASTWKRANHMEFHYIDGKQHIRVLYAIHYDEESENDPAIAWHALSYFDGLMNIIPTDDIEPEHKITSCPENPSVNYYNYCNDRYTDFTVHDCYSLDRNGSFLASLLDCYPEAKPWVDKYQKDKLRIKDIPKNRRTAQDKDILSYDKIFVGWLNNPKYHRHNAWCKIINNANEVIHKLRCAIEDAGHTVLVVNTDAVKFTGKFDYATSLEIGGFKYEWQAADMYIKGVKSYAYNEGNGWQFKQAGKCKLDELKPREQWTLDDFKNKDTYKVSKIIIKNKELIERYE